MTIDNLVGNRYFALPRRLLDTVSYFYTEFVTNHVFLNGMGTGSPSIAFGGAAYDIIARKTYQSVIEKGKLLIKISKRK